jgi:hypothetical protein
VNDDDYPGICLEGLWKIIKRTRVAGLWAEIRTRDLSSMKQECYPLGYDFRTSFYITPAVDTLYSLSINILTQYSFLTFMPSCKVRFAILVFASEETKPFIIRLLCYKKVFLTVLIFAGSRNISVLLYRMIFLQIESEGDFIVCQLERTGRVGVSCCRGRPPAVTAQLLVAGLSDTYMSR